MSELQTYKGANWVDVKDSDELVIYDTSKPTVIREADDGMYHITFRIVNIDDTGEEISDVCGTVTPQEVAVPRGSIIGEPQRDDKNKDFTIDFTYNGDVVATVSAVSLPDTVQYGYYSGMGDPEEGLINPETGEILRDGDMIIYFNRDELLQVTIQSNNSEYGTVNPELIGVWHGTGVTVKNNVLIFTPNEPYEQRVTATPNSGYLFQAWSKDGEFISGMQIIEEATTIVANFVEEGDK